MPALFIPECGFAEGSGVSADAGLTLVTAYGGAQLGFREYDTTVREHTLVFALCTKAEADQIYQQWLDNMLTGGMTFTVPWITGTRTCVYAQENGPAIRPMQGLWLSVTLVMREQA